MEFIGILTALGQDLVEGLARCKTNRGKAQADLPFFPGGHPDHKMHGAFSAGKLGIDDSRAAVDYGAIEGILQVGHRIREAGEAFGIGFVFREKRRSIVSVKPSPVENAVTSRAAGIFYASYA